MLLCGAGTRRQGPPSPHAGRIGRGVPGSGPQRRPGRVGGEALGVDLLLVAAPDVDRKEPWAIVATRIAEEHDDPAVRRPGRPLGVEARGQEALARAIRLHDADVELAARLAG